MQKLYFTLTLCLLFVSSAYAQDANYWSAAFNPAGFLTPGSAVASTRDSGLLYYNPALLAFNNKNSASISGSVYQFNTMKIKNGAGTGLDLRSNNLSIIPVMASGIISVNGGEKFTVGYAIAHNPVINYSTTQQLDGKYNVLNDSYSPGSETFIGQLSGQNAVNETIGMFSAGVKMAPQFAVGFAAEAQYRTQTLQQSYTARALINTPTFTGLPPITNAQESYQVSQYNVGIKFKFGLAYNVDKHHLGLNITSPLAKIKSSAQLFSDNLLSDLRLDGDTLSLLATTRQTKLAQKWKMPLSIAAGYAYDLGKKGQLYFSTEYFMKVNQYNIITPRDVDFVRLDGLDFKASDILKLIDSRRSVVNFGVGLSYLLKPNVTGYLTARTDFNYANLERLNNDDGYIATTANYNIYHVQIGGNLKKRKFNLRTGLLLDYGRTSKYLQPVDMTSANEDNTLSGYQKNTRASFLSVGLMFAYIYNL